MKHLGNIAQITGDTIAPVNVIIGGSPCQDLSIAGKRAGLAGERSGLFTEQIRIVKEMRKKHGTDYPRFMVWENVPGALSSNKGEDFRIVLEETAKISEPDAVIPRPPKGKWKNSGCIMGDGWSIAWRILNAQFWGVPQRRRRIALVVDFGGESAPEILFEREGVSGYTPQGFRPRQGAAGASEKGSGAAGCVCLNDQGGIRMDVTEDVAATLRAGTVPAAVYENHSQDTRYTGPLETAPTVNATYGMGGNNQPFVVNEIGPEYVVHRLTPTECERLQGFPEGWTDIGDYIDSKGRKKHTSDTARYRALGNSIALPPWRWVLKRLCNQYDRCVTMGSLFDGIGCFPLIWEEINGKGSCLWASEIEEFPIAVTKIRIGG